MTSTTHKTFRGPRGGMIFCKAAHAAAIDKAVFPGLQGGPHNHMTAAIAVAAHEAARPEFKQYARAVVDNAQALGAALAERGFGVITGGTDNHLLLVDVTSKGVTGKQLAQALDRAGIVLNYNAVPFDPRKPFDPSGVRIGTPAVTSRGMGKDAMLKIADWIDRVTQGHGRRGQPRQDRRRSEGALREVPGPGRSRLGAVTESRAPDHVPGVALHARDAQRRLPRPTSCTCRARRGARSRTPRGSRG